MRKVVLLLAAAVVGSSLALVAEPASAQATTGSVSGTVWFDTNANGRRDAGEPPLGSVAVVLVPCTTESCRLNTPNLPPLNWLLDAPMTGASDDNGNYSFTGVKPGRWRVKVTGVAASAVATTTRASGVPADLDSDLGPTLESDLLTVLPGTATVNVGGGVWDCLQGRKATELLGAVNTRVPSTSPVLRTDGTSADVVVGVNETLDARSASWNLPWVNNSLFASYPVKFSGSDPVAYGNACLVGGDLQIDLPDDAPWSHGYPFQYATSTPAWPTAACHPQPPQTAPAGCDDRLKFWKNTAALTTTRPSMKILGTHVHDSGDGVAMGAGATGFTIRGSRFTQIHDDCVENDGEATGVIDDTLFDGCAIFYSSRVDGQPATTGRNGVVTITNSLVHLKDLPTTFCGEPFFGPNHTPPDWVNTMSYYTASTACKEVKDTSKPWEVNSFGPGHGPMWKMNGSYTDPAKAVKLKVRNTVFYAESAPQYESTCPNNPSLFTCIPFQSHDGGIPYIDYLDPESCSNNLLLWGGDSSKLPWPTNSDWKTTTTKADDWQACFTVVAAGDGSSVDEIWASFRTGWLNAHAPAGGGFTPLTTPTHVYDSRTAGDGPIGTAPRPVSVPMTGGIPAASQIGALVVNLTATDITAQTFLRAWGAGDQPSTSNINLLPGDTRANTVTLAPGTGAGGEPMLQLISAVGTMNVVVDVVGFYRKSTSSSDLLYLPAQAPLRFDTRTLNGGAPINSTQPTFIAVPPSAAVPATATAVVANVTTVDPTNDTFLKTYPANLSDVGTSTINARTGEIVANQTVIKLGNGQTGEPWVGQRGLEIRNAVGSTHVAIDIVGAYVPSGTPGGLTYVPVAPTRLLDTRTGSPLPNGTAQDKALEALGTPARAVNLNITATQGSAPGYLRTYPAGAPAPTASILNWTTGQTIANGATVLLANDRDVTHIGRASFLSNSSSVHVVADVFGYFVPPNQLGYVS